MEGILQAGISLSLVDSGWYVCLSGCEHASYVVPDIFIWHMVLEMGRTGRL